MNEDQHRLAKTLLFAIALLIAGIYVWSTRFVYDYDGDFIVDKWSHKLYDIQE